MFGRLKNCKKKKDDNKIYLEFHLYEYNYQHLLRCSSYITHMQNKFLNSLIYSQKSNNYIYYTNEIFSLSIANFAHFN